MPFVPVPNTLGVQVVFEQAGQVMENTSYFEAPGDWTISDATAWLAAMRTFIETELMPLLSTTIQLVRLIGTFLETVDGFSVTNEVTPPVTGSDNGDAAPNQVSYTITFKTNSRGRSFRGRNYIAGLTSNVLATPNTVTSDFRTGLLAFYTGLAALATDNDFAMVVVSRFSGVDGDGKPIPRTTGVTTPITAFSTQDVNVDTQRRRSIGRGS